MSNTHKPNTVFWIIGILALLWNIMGVLAYLAQAYMSEEALNLLTQSEQDFYNNVPAWVTAAFASAVFTGFLGSIALLMRKKLSIALFTISLICVLAQQVYHFFIQDYITINGTDIIGPIVIIVISFFLMWYSKAKNTSGMLS
jgi:hypothetical protein